MIAMGLGRGLVACGDDSYGPGARVGGVWQGREAATSRSVHQPVATDAGHPGVAIRVAVLIGVGSS